MHGGHGWIDPHFKNRRYPDVTVAFPPILPPQSLDGASESSLGP